jgi:hypothetical protein
MIDVGSVFPADALNILSGPSDHSAQCAQHETCIPEPAPLPGAGAWGALGDHGFYLLAGTAS